MTNMGYEPFHGPDFYKNDTLSQSRNPEKDTLFNGTSPYRKIYEYPPPPGERPPSTQAHSTAHQTLQPHFESTCNSKEANMLLVMADK